MLQDRNRRKRMLASLDVAIGGTVKYSLDDADFRMTLRASVYARP